MHCVASHEFRSLRVNCSKHWCAHRGSNFLSSWPAQSSELVGRRHHPASASLVVESQIPPESRQLSWMTTPRLCKRGIIPQKKHVVWTASWILLVELLSVGIVKLFDNPALSRVQNVVKALFILSKKDSSKLVENIFQGQKKKGCSMARICFNTVQLLLLLCFSNF